MLEKIGAMMDEDIINDSVIVGNGNVVKNDDSNKFKEGNAHK